MAKDFISADVLATLKECSEEQLLYMAKLADDPNFSNFITIARQLIERRKNIVFEYPEIDPQKLAVFKANARGQVDGVLNLLHVIKGVQQELKRRKKEKR